MAINPLTFQTPQAFSGGVDWSPLERIGAEIARQREEADAAEQIRQLDERLRRQQAAAQTAAQQTAPQQVAAPQPPQPAIQTGMLPPVPGYNISGNPVVGAAPAAAAATGVPDTMPKWLQSALAGNYDPATPQPRVDPRSPIGRLMARLGKGPSPDGYSPPTPFPIAGAAPLPGQVPPNAQPVVPEPPWYDPAAAQATAQFPMRSGAAPPAPMPPYPVFPAGGAPPVPGLPPAAAPPAAAPAPPAVAAPTPSYNPPLQAMAFAPEGDPMDRFARATSTQESGSPEGNYRAVGPQTKYGRALGRYQVLASNVPDWTEKFYGERLTPTQFLNNPRAQDAVYRGQFGEYVDKYGPEGAARAWFAGERNMNNPRASDGGTTVSAYADNFMRNAGLSNGNLPPEITAGASRPAAAPAGAMAFDATTAAPAAPAAAAPAYGRAVQNLTSPQAPASAADISSEELAALYRNPLTRPIATAFLQKRLDPGNYDFVVAGDQLYRVNKLRGTAEPVPVHQKLMAVGEEQRVFDPNTRTYVSGESDTGKYGKLGANMRWVDINDKSKGQEPIPGTPPTQLPAEVAAKIGLAGSFLNNLPSIKQRLENNVLGIDVNPTGHLAAVAGVGAGAETKRQIESGADALLRMLTGAGMGIQEATDYAMRYRPTARDTKDQLLSKMSQLEGELHATADLIGRGRGGSALAGIKRTFSDQSAPAPGAAAIAPGTPTQLQIGNSYYGRKYLGGPPGDPRSWGPRTQ